MVVRFGLVTAAVGLGIAVASGHNIAWADGPTDTADRSPGQSAPGNPDTDAGSRNGVDKPDRQQPKKPGTPKLKLDLGAVRDWAAKLPKPTVPTVDQAQDQGGASAQSGVALPSLQLKSPIRGRDLLAQWKANRDKVPAFEPPTVTDLVAADRPVLTGVSLAAPERLRDKVTELAAPEATAAVTPLKTPKLMRVALVAPQAIVAADTAVDPVITTTSTPQPQPLSPLAKLIDAPARLVNKVLQALDFTSSASGPDSPLDWNPIDEFVFALFRRTEEALGLGKTPEVTAPNQIEYSCSEHDCTRTTPTVEQFLNAATAEYTLGGQPADLEPFVVNGHQMRSTNTLSGMSASAWVTPEGQVIIAYSGTTGGTNLLANPVIAVTQVIADVQVVVTRTTPWAFYDSLAFANQVREEAHKQGYADEDIFVTGHSLGGWEAQYVAQQTGLGGIGFEGPGLNTTNPDNGNGDNSNFVNVLTYGDPAAYFASDVPGLQPLLQLLPGGDNKPHYGNIVMIGDAAAAYPMLNAAALFGENPIYIVVLAVDLLGNFFQYHLPGVQAYHLDVDPDPGVVPWLGNTSGSVYENWGDLTIPQLQAAASDREVLFT